MPVGSGCSSSLRLRYHRSQRARQLALGCEYKGVELAHDTYAEAWRAILFLGPRVATKAMTIRRLRQCAAAVRLGSWRASCCMCYCSSDTKCSNHIQAARFASDGRCCQTSLLELFFSLYYNQVPTGLCFIFVIPSATRIEKSFCLGIMYVSLLLLLRLIIICCYCPSTLATSMGAIYLQTAAIPLYKRAADASRSLQR